MSETVTIISGVSKVGQSEIIRREKALQLNDKLSELGVRIKNSDGTYRALIEILNDLAQYYIEDEGMANDIKRIVEQEKISIRNKRINDTIHKWRKNNEESKKH